ncbi:pimeloyl-ACP methyl esterase BioG family protein [Helicobacter sp. 23-1048]
MKWEVVGDLDSLCCVFFAGFGFNIDAYKEFLKPNTLVVFDYRDFNNTKELLCLLKQRQFCLVAFSMGVSVAHHILSPLCEHITQSSAVNGTILGIDKTKGIHPSVFAHTIKHFSPQAFVQNCLNKQNAPHFHTLLNDTNALIAELKSLHDFSQAQQCENLTQNTLMWDRAIISLRDCIFKPEVQNLAWSAYKQSYDTYFTTQKTFEIRHIDAPHFVFKDNDACQTIC